MPKMEITTNMLSVRFATPSEIADDIAGRVRSRRLERNWTQEVLAERSGVSLATLRRFEQKGQISLERLLRLAVALDALDEFRELFRAPRIRTLDELEESEKERQRARPGDIHG